MKDKKSPPDALPSSGEGQAKEKSACFFDFITGTGGNQGGNMTKEQKLEACSMRFDGASLQEIADHFGVPEKYIHRIVPRCSNVGRRRLNPIIYKKIDRYMEENDLSVESFASISGTSRQFMNAILSGKNSPSKKTIDKILKVTGMTYEEAFYIPSENSSQPLREETT